MKKLDDACAAFGDSAKDGRMQIMFTRVVFTEEHVRLLRDHGLAILIVDPVYAATLKVGSVRWIACLILPQKGSTLQIERAAETKEEAEGLLADAMFEALAEEARAAS